jgi:threonine aldolase
MTNFNRRNFIRLSGLSLMPVLPSLPAFAGNQVSEQSDPPAERLFFINDGPMYRPADFISKLDSIQKSKPIQRDFYASGGVVDELTKKFAAITGKEAAIFMPSGTMANQLAIAVLSGDNTKVFVQDTSHVYRDEADAAQSVHNKRLIPLAKEQAYFTQEDLASAIAYQNDAEVFKSGIGAVSIENPVRRSDGRMVPLEEIKKISAWCRKEGYKLHLDGARLHMASAWSGTSIAEYAGYFDTVYISLYKYLGAGGGAILCGDKNVIGKMEHLVKVHGGTVFSNWTNAAMALYHLEGLDERLQKTIAKANELISMLNKLPELKISALENGTNIYHLQLSAKVNSDKLSNTLRDEHNIILARTDKSGLARFMINDSLLSRENTVIVESFKKSLATAV